MRSRWFPAALVAAGALLGWLSASGRLAEALAQDKKAEAKAPESPPLIPPDFKGVIKLDVRDSKADWKPFTPKAAPKGAPNVLFILYDDTGLAAWSPYGGRIDMPTMDRLAKNGLTYTQWQTTALCSRPGPVS